MADRLPVIMRPNGQPYRPRTVIAHHWEIEGHLSESRGVVVLGTHDLDRARALATEAIVYWFDDRLTACKPEPGWYRLALRHGEPTWIHDEVNGRAGIMFTAIEEQVPSAVERGGQP
jgi:hypothetical protein